MTPRRRRRFRTDRRASQEAKTAYLLHLPVWLHRDFKKLCDEGGISMNDAIRCFVLDRVEEYQKEHGPLTPEEDATVA
jgi:hypothetical protein